MEELRDVYSHFMLYYGHEIPAMRLAKTKKPKDEEKEEGEETQEEEPQERVKMPKRRDLYTICREAGTWRISCLIDQSVIMVNIFIIGRLSKDNVTSKAT